MLNVISLFTGAGGLDIGFEAAGFRLAVGVEMDSHCVETLAANRAWPILHGKIESFESRVILKRAALAVREADVLIGGPPCQPFSKSAYWVKGDTKRLDDSRASTLEQFLRVLRDTKPVAYLLENVPGLGYRKKDEGLGLLTRTIRDINSQTGTNYSTLVAVLNAANFGAPQERSRIFIIGHRDGLEFDFEGLRQVVAPASDARDSSSSSSRRNAWDSIGDLEDDDDPTLKVTGKWADLLPAIPEGQNYLYHTPAGEGQPLFGWRTKYWSFLLKLAKDLPSWTLTAQPGPAIGPFHWKNRRLSVREMARIQTFPDDYHIVGDLRAARLQLGNAVPSVLAECLARAIKAQFFGAPEAASEPLKLLPGLRRPTPSPDPVARVPRKYLALRADHQPHPGTGKGPGAVRRGT